MPRKNEKGPEVCCYWICETGMGATRMLQYLQSEVVPREIKGVNSEVCRLKLIVGKVLSSYC